MQRPYISPQQEQELQHEYRHTYQRRLSPNPNYEFEGGINYRYVNQFTPSQSSLTPPMQSMQVYGVNPYPNQQHYENFYIGSDHGLGIQMDGYGTPGSVYYSEDGLEGHELSYFHGQSHSPPTPMSAVDSDCGYRNRSVRKANRTASPQSTKASETPEPRKPKPKKEKMKRLTAPLSELTKDYENIPVRDMDAWVNRSVQTRLGEVVKKKGKISRPMNSFMLYRSAYAERTKAWCSENNHQVVSSISGESWPMEPSEVRDRYNNLAKLERINHQAAHPEYKFSPSKPGAAGRKRKGASFDDESDPGIDISDLDDPDAEWGPPGQRKNRPRQPRRNAASVTSAPSVGMMNSMFETTNEGRMLPERLDPEEMHQTYYQQEVKANALNPVVEDVKLKMVGNPGMQSYAAPVVGLPSSGQHHHLLESPQERFSSQVDPSLLAFERTDYNASSGRTQTVPTQASPISPRSRSTMSAGQHIPEGYAPARQVSAYEISSWEADEANLRSLETGSEFDNWHT